MTPIDARIYRAVETTRSIWGFTMVVLGIFTLVELPLLWMLPFIIFAVATYYGSLAMLSLWLAAIIPLEELQTSKFGGGLEQMLVAEGVVIGTSAELVGRFQDKNMYEWIDVQDKGDNTILRYFFEHVAEKDAGGNTMIPITLGYAHYDGIIYKVKPPAQPELFNQAG